MNQDQTPYSELIDAWVDGEATPEQVAQLTAWLKQDREHVRIFVRQTHAHRSLRELAIAGQAQERMPRQSRPRRSGPKLHARSASRRSWLVAGLAACIVAAIAVFYFTQSRAPALATIAELNGEVSIKRGSQTLAAKQGFELQANDVVQTRASSSAAVVFQDGTRIGVQAGSEVALRPAGAANSNVLVASGQIDAAVAKQPAGQPFVLETPHARATVIGTRFTLNAEKDSSQLDVNEGRVKFARLSASDDALEVPAGAYVRFDPGATSSCNALRASQAQPIRVIEDHEGALNWYQVPSSVPVGFELSNQQAHGGKKSLRIAYQHKAKDRDPYTELLHPIVLQRGDRALRFSIFVESSDPKANWNIQIRLRNQSCWIINSGLLKDLKPGWNDIELDLQRPPQQQAFGGRTVYTPETADALIFSICTGSATFFLDDFGVVPTASGTTK